MGLLDGQGPVFVVEPPPRMDWGNNTGCRLECSARGSPPPAIQWTLEDGSTLAATDLRYQLPNGSLVFQPFSSAQFRTEVHRTSYRCVATNSHGRIISREVKLRASEYLGSFLFICMSSMYFL